MLIMMTSVECPHCHDLRGKGVMGCGAYFMKPSVIAELLSVHSQVNMINLHFKNGGQSSNVVEISKIQLEGKNVIQEIWCESENKVKRLTVYAYSDTKKFLRTKQEFKGNWQELIEKMIPLKIKNYTFYYPCFMMVETENWMASIESNAELYGVTNAGKTIEVNGSVKLDKDGKSLNDRMMEPIQLIQNVVSGEIALRPSAQEPEPEPEPEEPPPPVQPTYSRY